MRWIFYISIRPDQFNVLLLGFSQLKTGATDRFFFNLQAWHPTKDCIIRMKGSLYKIINENYKNCSVWYKNVKHVHHLSFLFLLHAHYWVLES